MSCIIIYKDGLQYVALKILRLKDRLSEEKSEILRFWASEASAGSNSTKVSSFVDMSWAP